MGLNAEEEATLPLCTLLLLLLPLLPGLEEAMLTPPGLPNAPAPAPTTGESGRLPCGGGVRRPIVFERSEDAMPPIPGCCLEGDWGGESPAQPPRTGSRGGERRGIGAAVLVPLAPPGE